MGHKFAEIAFTDAVKEIQQAEGSRKAYARMEASEDSNHLLGAVEAAFIAERDSLYMASVSETGWPYLQHRGGPPGFMKVLDARTLGFADFRGNRQYVSTGNFSNNDRVSLFFMDYPRQRRLKLLGRVRQLAGHETALAAQLSLPDYPARVERGFIVRLEAFDWNCPQHITPRYSQAEVSAMMAPLLKEIEMLKQQLNLPRRD